jgi:hypothetical protein
MDKGAVNGFSAVCDVQWREDVFGVHLARNNARVGVELDVAQNIRIRVHNVIVLLNIRIFVFEVLQKVLALVVVTARIF